MNDPSGMEPWTHMFFRLPQTGPGRWSAGLDIGFALFLGLFFGLVAAGQRGGMTFFSNPWLATTLLLAVFLAVAAGLLAGFGIFWKNERSIVAFLALVVGLFVLYMAAGEILFPH